MSALFVSPVGNLSLSVKRHPALLGMMERCMRSNLRIGIGFFWGGETREWHWFVVPMWLPLYIDGCCGWVVVVVVGGVEGKGWGGEQTAVCRVSKEESNLSE